MFPTQDVIDDFRNELIFLMEFEFPNLLELSSLLLEGNFFEMLFRMDSMGVKLPKLLRRLAMLLRRLDMLLRRLGMLFRILDMLLRRLSDRFIISTTLLSEFRLLLCFFSAAASSKLLQLDLVCELVFLPRSKLDNVSDLEYDY